MIYKFKSKATGDLIMTQPVGERVLSLIGKPATPQGIIEVEQLAGAMSALEAAVAARHAGTLRPYRQRQACRAH